jgi:hypothetical protein
LIGKVEEARESWTAFEQEATLGYRDASEQVKVLRKQADDTKSGKDPKHLRKAADLIKSIELEIKGDRLESDYAQKHGPLLMGSTPYFEEVLKRFTVKWVAKFPVQLDGDTSQSEIIKLELAWLNFHFFWNMSWLDQKDRLENIYIQLRALGIQKTQWQAHLMIRSYPREHREWPVEWVERIAGKREGGLVTDQEFQAWYKAKGINIDEPFTSPHNAPRCQGSCGIGATDGNRSDHGRQCALVSTPDSDMTVANGFDSVYLNRGNTNYSNARRLRKVRDRAGIASEALCYPWKRMEQMMRIIG